MDEDKHKNYYTKFPNSIMSDASLLSSAKVVYAAIRSFGNWKDGGSCYPTLPQIAKRAGMGKKTVDRSIRILQAKGYLKWTKGRTGVANQYGFPLETSGTLARVRGDSKRGSSMTLHREQTEIYRPSKHNQILTAYGYENCERCYLPEPICSCPKLH